MRRLILSGIAFLVAGVASCGSSETAAPVEPTPSLTYLDLPKCGPHNCLGCCRDDFCHVPSATECGVGGDACITCAGSESCSRNGYCISTGFDGGPGTTTSKPSNRPHGQTNSGECHTWVYNGKATSTCQ